jgi:hypothetical protein
MEKNIFTASINNNLAKYKLLGSYPIWDSIKYMGELAINVG